MELLLLPFVLVLCLCASMGFIIWVIRDRASLLTDLRLQVDQQRAEHLARERELMNRLLAKDPSEFLTLQAGVSVTEWPKRRQLLTDREEAVWDRERKS